MGEHLSDEQRNLLKKLAGMRGVIWVRGTEADVARELADTKLIALGPDEESGALSVLITGEGRAVL